MRVVIFGTGAMYQFCKVWIPKEDISAFIDNDFQKQGSYIDGIQVCSPEYVLHNAYDKIVLFSKNINEMKSQLLNMGVPEDKIWTWIYYNNEIIEDKFKLLGFSNYSRRILVISHELNYSGGPMAAVHAVQSLQTKGYQVVLVAPSGNPQFIKEMTNVGVNIVLCPAIYHVSHIEMHWINQFDIVLVNVFLMISCACEISKFKPVLWWLHEVSTVYEDVRESFSQYDNLAEMKYINIAAVSEIAKSNFEVYYPQRVNHVLPYGIPDENTASEIIISSDKLIFAIVGNICERKAQKVFVQAVMNLSLDERAQAEFWIIGAEDPAAYCKELKELVEYLPQVKLLGQLDREKMIDAYQKIDVVVCASMEECLPTVVVEGMMFGKICITTDATGMDDYITHGENGFICEVGNIISLYETMKWIIAHENELQYIRDNARKTYEKYFTMEKFGDELESLLLETERIYTEKIASMSLTDSSFL